MIQKLFKEQQQQKKNSKTKTKNPKSEKKNKIPKMQKSLTCVSLGWLLQKNPGITTLL